MTQLVISSTPHCLQGSTAAIGYLDHVLNSDCSLYAGDFRILIYPSKHNTYLSQPHLCSLLSLCLEFPEKL